MNIEGEFLEAIFKAPLDTFNYLVYADWLDDNHRHQEAGVMRERARIVQLPAYGPAEGIEWQLTKIYIEDKADGLGYLIFLDGTWSYQAMRQENTPEEMVSCGRWARLNE